MGVDKVYFISVLLVSFQRRHSAPRKSCKLRYKLLKRTALTEANCSLAPRLRDIKTWLLVSYRGQMTAAITAFHPTEMMGVLWLRKYR
jgi:hypothetical protein